MLDARWERAGEILEFHIEADSFMRHMNRVLVGTMLEVGHGPALGRGLRRAARGPAARGGGPHGAALRALPRGGPLLASSCLARMRCSSFAKSAIGCVSVGGVMVTGLPTAVYSILYSMRPPVMPPAASRLAAGVVNFEVRESWRTVSSSATDGLEARAAEGALDLRALLRREAALGDGLGGAGRGEGLAQALVLVHHRVGVDRAGVDVDLLAVEGAGAGLLDVLDRGERVEADLGEALLLGGLGLLGDARDGLLAGLEVLAAEVDEEVVARGDDAARELWSSGRRRRPSSRGSGACRRRCCAAGR